MLMPIFTKQQCTHCKEDTNEGATTHFAEPAFELLQ